MHTPKQLIISNQKRYQNLLFCFCLVIFILFLSGCGHQPPPPSLIYEEKPIDRLPSMNFTIQVGAFQKIENAINLTKQLKNQGVEAYHFIHPDGLFKVRFGNYRSFSEANLRAAGLVQKEIIQEYYIVRPDNSWQGSIRVNAETSRRQSIVRTARRFIGIPYKWGGDSPREGFDCSGLTMVTYRLNGLELPRNSAAQFQTGRPISKAELKKGDLVFFKTTKRRRVSHVGIYVGNDSFIHAPKQGKTITTTSLSGSYYKKRYVGARTYF